MDWFGAWALAAVAVVLVSGACTQTDARPRPLATRTLRVATYNLKMWDREPSRHRRAPLILAEIRRTGADVIALQEVGGEFYKRLRLESGYAHISPNQCSLVVLSRLRILRAHGSYLPGGYDCYEMQRVWLRLPGGRLLVGHVHLKSALAAGKIRIQQLRRSFRLMAEGNVPDRILMGDFNFGDRARENAYLPPSYRDAWRRLRPLARGYTWDRERSWLARRSSFPGEPSRRLDRILVRSGRMTASAVRIFGNRPRGRWFASDHFGLAATLVYR